MHSNQPGRYLYRLLSYGKASENWIGLFDEAEKDNMEPLELKENSLDELVKKTQAAFESKYINEDKKQKLLVNSTSHWMKSTPKSILRKKLKHRRRAKPTVQLPNINFLACVF